MKIGIFGGGAISGFLEKFLKEKTNYKIISYPRNKLDVTNSESVGRVVKENQFDYLFSLAGLSNITDSFQTPQDYYEVNTGSTFNILNSVRLYSPQTKTIFAGSIHEITNSSPYSGSKKTSSVIVENFRNSYKLWAAQPKFSNVIVERSGDFFVIPKIVNHFKKKDFSCPLELGNVFSEKKWLDVNCLCRGLWDVATQDKPFDLILSGEENVSVKTIVEFAAEAVNIQGKWEILTENHVFMDKNTVYAVNNPLNSRPNENIEYDIQETKKVLGWEPKISVKESIEKLIYD